MAGPLHFTTPERVVRRTKIELDDEELWAIEPKASMLMQLGEGVRDDDYQSAVVFGFIDLVFDDADAARLRERLSDPDDWFDMDTFNQIIDGLKAAWSARPTGRSSGSSKRRRSTGPTSTAPAPSEV